MKRNLELTPGSKYADVWQSANYLHVSEAAIRKWLSTGRLARRRCGRRVLVLVADLDALIVTDTPAAGEAA
jgi:excisionase family DNA binding protein